MEWMEEAEKMERVKKRKKVRKVWYKFSEQNVIVVCMFLCQSVDVKLGKRVKMYANKWYA